MAELGAGRSRLLLSEDSNNKDFVCPDGAATFTIRIEVFPSKSNRLKTVGSYAPIPVLTGWNIFKKAAEYDNEFGPSIVQNLIIFYHISNSTEKSEYLFRLNLDRPL